MDYKFSIRLGTVHLSKRKKGFSSTLVTLALSGIFFQNCSNSGFSNNAASSLPGVQNSSSSSPSSGTENVELGWDPDTDAGVAGYKIYYGTSSGSRAQSVDVGLLQPINGVITYILPQLTSGQTYYFSIVAYDANKVESPNSNEVSQLVQ